jgi:hypothetical protein
MGILQAMDNQKEADEYALLLQAALTYGEDVKIFAIKHLLPHYLACGRGYEPADLNVDLVRQFEEEPGK